MTPITHRNPEIERLERELTESREECRRLQSQLQTVAEIVQMEMSFRPTNLSAYAYNLTKRINATLAPKVEDK